MCRLKQSTNEMLVERRNGHSLRSDQTNLLNKLACILYIVSCIIRFANERDN